MILIGQFTEFSLSRLGVVNQLLYPDAARRADRNMPDHTNKVKMIQMFKDTRETSAHAAFQAWRRLHNHGFFLNLKTKTAGQIHRALCRHPGNTTWECNDDGSYSLTKKQKICSDAFDELSSWAASNGLATVKRCPDCNPFPERR